MLGKAQSGGVATDPVPPTPSTMSVSQAQVDADRDESVSGSTVAPAHRTPSASDLEKGSQSKSPGSDNHDDRDERYNVDEKTDENAPTTVVTSSAPDEFPEGGLRAWSVVLGVESNFQITPN